MIKAIIFDCFGVLVVDGWLPFKQRVFGDNPDLFAESTDLSKQMDRGIISYEDFLNGVAELAGMDLRDVRSEIENNPQNVPLLDYIKTSLKPNYKIGMLSNAGANWLDELFSADQIELFDAVSLSYQSGYIKPDAGAYQAIASMLGVDLTECIFVDDQERYCTGATDAGMRSIVYTNHEQAIQEIGQKIS